MSAIRVLIADDEIIVCDGLQIIIDLEDDLTVIGTAHDGTAAVEAVRRLRPDIALLDIHMPGLTGIEATREILRMPEPPRVLVLTTFDRNELVYEALRAGASGYLLKDTSRRELNEAIRTVHRGDALLAPRITKRLIEEFCRGPSPSPTATPALDLLTPREREVLLLIARGRSNQEIAAELVVAETTIKTHIARVLTKLGLRDRAQAVVLAYESGLVRPGR